jgi:hypothetical protein
MRLRDNSVIKDLKKLFTELVKNYVKLFQTKLFSDRYIPGIS